MTPDQLARATEATPNNALKYHQPLIAAMERFSIVTPRQRAAFIGGTVAIESLHLAKVEEDLYYKDAARLANIYKRHFGGNAAKAEPYTRNSAALGKLLYQGFWGRGLIQLTWKENYEACGKALGFDYLGKPDLLKEPWHAAMSAAWFWDSKDCNEPAEAGNMVEVTRKVNGPALMHLKERKAGFELALKVGV